MTLFSRGESPGDLTIRPRDRRFGRDRTHRRWWLAGDPVATAFYNALSVTFPKGEGFFIESVRHFRDGAPPRLEREIAAFVRQEVLHTREHVAFNRHVAAHGYDISRLDAEVDRLLARARKAPPIVSLAATMALEHLTAIIAHEVLVNRAHFAGADPEAAAMWRWHAVEEIEHKGVAYDTWLHATRHWSRFRRWRVKTLVALIVTWQFFRGRTRGVLDLLAQDGLRGPRLWARLLWYALGQPGMSRKIMLAWAGFFLPGFHPWNRDDRALIRLADSDYADAVLPTAA